MKTTPMAHQTEALKRCENRRWFGLFMEMGTGKTWTILADAERAWAQGKIDSLLVIAPKGVHTNWTRREIPEHLEIPHVAAAYRSGMNKREQRAIDALFDEPPDEERRMRVLAINIDALLTKQAYDLAVKFLTTGKAMMVVDESDRIKNANSSRTKRVLALGARAVARRICTGTPITNSPIDVFSQMEFLQSGLLGTSSLRAFTAEYAELLPESHALMKNIRQRVAQRAGQAAARMAVPQIVARDATGAPRWRNLDRLQRLLEPHTFRVRKAECLDLPPKVYTHMFFQLTPELRRMYDRLENELRLEFEGEPPTVVSALGALTKLQQLTSGFVNVEGEPRLVQPRDNPRLDALLELVESIPGQFIVWARFTEELRQIADALRERDIAVAEYHGRIGTTAREDAVDGFQAGAYRAFVGQPQSGGIGLTLTAATTVVYYSNDFNMGTRNQSEDRAHRRGTKSSVLYVDIVAEDTIDQPISRALQRKTRLAAEILGDRSLRVPASVGEN